MNQEQKIHLLNKAEQISKNKTAKILNVNSTSIVESKLEGSVSNSKGIN